MIFDYFFFKFYNWILKTSIPEYPGFMASCFLGGIIMINMIMLNVLLAKLDILPFMYNEIIYIIGLTVTVAIVFLIYNKSRIEVIKSKFAEDEFKPKKRTFNIIFVLFLVLTILAIFIVPSYKPGYLPTFFD